MKNETWEMSTLDWTKKGADGAIVSSADVGNLVFSENKEQARIAYFIVSEAVGQNGWIYPCALTVVKTILAALPTCCSAARIESLDLISQIAASESAPDAQDIAGDCLREIRGAYWYFIYGLQFDSIEMASLYVDILGCLGKKFDDLTGEVEKYLELSLAKNLPKNDLEMIRNTIVELSK